MELREKLSVVRQLAPPISAAPRSALLTLSIGSGVQLPDGRKCLVADVYTYEELNKKGASKQFFWREYKLVCLSSFDEVYLEIEDDDGLSAYLTVESVAAGRISPDPENEPREITVRQTHGTMPMYLDEKGYARFTRATRPDAPAENVTLLDYESDDENTLLGVELWDGNAEAFTYKEVDVKKIRIFAHKEAKDVD